MSSILKYKGYLGRVDVDGDELFGRVINTEDVITFVGSTVPELRQALQESIDGYLAHCAEIGKAPNKPYSGQFVVRVDPRVHASLVAKAAEAELSLNDFVRTQLETAAAVPSSAPARTPKGRRPRAAAGRTPHARRVKATAA